MGAFHGIYSAYGECYEFSTKRDRENYNLFVPVGRYFVTIIKDN